MALSMCVEMPGIYEAMAAKIPMVSTTIGAEGLVSHPPDDIRIADTTETLAEQCLESLRGRWCAREDRGGVVADGVRQFFVGTGLALLREGHGANASCILRVGREARENHLARPVLLPQPFLGVVVRPGLPHDHPDEQTGSFPGPACVVR
jgi:hypothetical protein